MICEDMIFKSKSFELSKLKSLYVLWNKTPFPKLITWVPYSSPKAKTQIAFFFISNTLTKTKQKNQLMNTSQSLKKLTIVWTKC